MHVTMFYSLSYRIWVVQFLFSAAHNFVHCLNLVLIHYWLLSLRFTLLHIACSNMSSLRINKFCLHQSSWWLYRLRRVTNFCLLSWDLPIILWVTFRAYSLLFLPAKAMQNNFRKFEELAFYNLWFPDSGFRILDSGFRIPDSGFRFRILVSDSGFRVLGLPKKLNMAVSNRIRQWIKKTPCPHTILRALR